MISVFCVYDFFASSCSLTHSFASPPHHHAPPFTRTRTLLGKKSHITKSGLKTELEVAGFVWCHECFARFHIDLKLVLQIRTQSNLIINTPYLKEMTLELGASLNANFDFKAELSLDFSASKNFVIFDSGIKLAMSVNFAGLAFRLTPRFILEADVGLKVSAKGMASVGFGYSNKYTKIIKYTSSGGWSKAPGFYNPRRNIEKDADQALTKHAPLYDISGSIELDIALTPRLEVEFSLGVGGSKWGLRAGLFFDVTAYISLTIAFTFQAAFHKSNDECWEVKKADSTCSGFENSGFTCGSSSSYCSRGIGAEDSRISKDLLDNCRVTKRSAGTIVDTNTGRCVTRTYNGACTSTDACVEQCEGIWMEIRFKLSARFGLDDAKVSFNFTQW